LNRQYNYLNKNF